MLLNKISPNLITHFSKMIELLMIIIFKLILFIFFRTVTVRGGQNIPKDGPVIFAIAPHCNQFIDPMMVIATAQRKPGFIIAKKSYDRYWIGKFARILGSIPVIRKLDITTIGQGRIFIDSSDSIVLRGVGSEMEFT
jgi:glycerol-3-phosphate O-acyltransferase/dihydroxyacetone phosphate acyltransferase